MKTMEDQINERISEAVHNSFVLYAKSIGLSVETDILAETTSKMAESVGIKPDTSEKNWDPASPEYVVPGTIRTFENKKYECIQSHVIQSDWSPNITPALWKVVDQPGEDNWKSGVSYKIGDKRRYPDGGQLYECIQAHTSQSTWTPPAVASLWKKA